MPRVQTTQSCNRRSVVLWNRLPTRGTFSMRPGSDGFNQKNPKTVHRNPKRMGSVYPSYSFRKRSTSLDGSSSESRSRKRSSSRLPSISGSPRRLRNTLEERKQSWRFHGRRYTLILTLNNYTTWLAFAWSLILLPNPSKGMPIISGKNRHTTTYVKLSCIFYLM